MGGLPPHLEGWEEYCRLVERLTAAGLIQTSKELWWDVRPSPLLGTVEIRIFDMPPDLPSVVGLTALTQCLVVDLAARQSDRPSIDACGRLVALQNRWRAAPFGTEAELVDPRVGCRSPAREVIKGLLLHLRVVAEALGCSGQLALARTMADAPTRAGATRRLRTDRRPDRRGPSDDRRTGATRRSGQKRTLAPQVGGCSRLGSGRALARGNKVASKRGWARLM
jgi:carboxylate-amine ligase